MKSLKRILFASLLVICGSLASACVIQQSFDNVDEEVVLINNVSSQDVQLAFEDLVLVGKELNSHAFNSGVMSLDVFVYYGGFYTESEPYQITQEKRFPLARSSVTMKPRN